MAILTERIGLTTKEWMIMKTPIPTIFMTVVYLYIVLKVTPRYMKERKPFKLSKFIQCYNVFQIVANGLIVYNMIDIGIHKLFFRDCREPTYVEGILSERSDRLECYVLYTKLVDYIETVVFVLRKKQRQVSFLHLYHHVSTVHVVWLMIKYYSPGMLLTFSMVNCSVHVIMYFYYFLSSLGPSLQKLLNPIKPIITTIQMVQFAVLAVFILQFVCFNCASSNVMTAVVMGNIAMNAILFSNFYRKNYRKQGKQKC